MIVARTIEKQLDRASCIRRMFEEGARLKQERGADNVFDFTLGNPAPSSRKYRRSRLALPLPVLRGTAVEVMVVSIGQIRW